MEKEWEWNGAGRDWEGKRCNAGAKLSVDDKWRDRSPNLLFIIVIFDNYKNRNRNVQTTKAPIKHLADCNLAPCSSA